tara:strand:- start:785 stop:1786 length:1002 start_codon:yes stop_codon:yes gene_type:complete
MSFSGLDQLNSAIQKFELPIYGGKYQCIKSVIPSHLCQSICDRLLERFFNVGASRNSIRLLINKKDLHPANFLTCRTGDGLIDHVNVSDSVVRNIIEDGGTLVFDHAQEYFIELQVIQEHLEALIGCKCWIQCYVTKSSSTAFGMHGDDHPFLIIQLNGTKKWLHSEDDLDVNSDIVYQPGDIAFYPRGKLHDVHGTGDLSIHLTVAFDGFNGVLLNEVSKDQLVDNLLTRIGSSLPYSVCPYLIDENTTVRLAYSGVPLIDNISDSTAELTTKYTTVKMPTDFIDVLHWMKLRRSTSAQQISDAFDLEIDRCKSFISFGLQNSILINSLGVA